jgi:Putative zinc-finger
MGPHEEFLELCAVSTSGDLTEKEQRKLQAHLATCAECRQAMREFEAAVDIGVPLLSSKLSVAPSEESGSPQGELAGPVFPKTVPREQGEAETGALITGEKRGFAFSERNGHGRAPLNWSVIWLPFAACILLTIALGIYSYRMGRSRNAEVVRVISNPNDTQVGALEQRLSDAGHDREVLKAQLGERDRFIADLKRRADEQSKTLNAMDAKQANLEQSLQNDEAEKQRVAEERASFAQKLDAAQASLQRMQADLDTTQRQRSEEQSRDVSLQAQIRDLSGQLREREQTIDKQDDLLSHDRDIRDLMGARDLYIAEVYDVARDGATQKPYGRVFYTKGRSLIFYAYDLNQEAGVKNVSTFQAWGRRGADKEQAVNLGIFYQDSAAKKRWVLKFDDPKALEQIDAVFVTVEPNGGSQMPSGKPLLFAYLKIDPNHP